MSLVGSLEDLGLADILQLVSLARKSGVLVVRSEKGEGRIAFQGGLIHAARLKGEDALPPRPAASAGGSPAERECPELSEDARRELVERAVAHMFEWPCGEFSFEMRDDLDPADAERALETGISPQYLTMEATRRGDELRAGMDPEPLAFGGEESAPGGPHEVLVDAVLERADPPAGDALARAEEPAGESAPAGSQPAACSVAVLVDPELAALEWVKAQIGDLFERVHIFQGAEGGIARIRQYLSRGELPAVLLSERAPMDPLSGIDSASELLRRLRVQAPRMPLLILAEAGLPPPRASRLADGVVLRPSVACLLDPRGSESAAAAARALRAGLAPFAALGRRAGAS
jgi:hypothetical protein